MKALGIVLIVLGVLALAYGGFTYTREKKVVDLGPIQASRKETNTVPLPPILGVSPSSAAVFFFSPASGSKLWH